MTQNNENFKSDMLEHVYGIYDLNLGRYERPFVLTEVQLHDFCRRLANDVNTDYYFHPELFNIVDLGVFNSKFGTIENNSSPIIVFSLSDFVDEHIRDIQTCALTLSTLPTGYFKMPVEMQKEIQDKINEQIKVYVETFGKKEITPAN